MKFRGILTAFVALALVTIASNAQAMKLVVMAVNQNGAAPAGSKTYTIGVDASSLPVGNYSLALQNVDFQRSGGNPIQGTPDRANYQSLVNGTNPAGAMTTDTFWYFSADGNLTDLDGNQITTDPVVGPAGFLWNGGGVGGATGGAGTAQAPLGGFGAAGDLVITGVYGPLPTFVPGGQAGDIYPLVQIRTSADMTIKFDPTVKLSAIPQGAGNEILSNVLGGAQTADPAAFLSFSQNIITTAPEPSTFVLAGFGVVGFLAYRRRRSK